MFLRIFPLFKMKNLLVMIMILLQFKNKYTLKPIIININHNQYYKNRSFYKSKLNKITNYNRT